MIIVRSEKAFNRPPTSIGTDPGTMVAAAPMKLGTFSTSQDRKVYPVHSMRTESDEISNV
jgi:hypothetical protein